MKLTAFTAFFLLSVFCFGQADNVYINIKIDSLPEGEFNAELCYTFDGVLDSVVYSCPVSSQNNTFSYRGMVSEEMLTTFRIRRKANFDFSMGPGDSVYIELTIGEPNFNYRIKGSKRPVQMANYLYGIFLPQARNLNRRKVILDSLGLATGSRDALRTARKGYDSLYEVYFKYNTAFSDTTASASSVYYALSRYLSDTGKLSIQQHVESALIRFPPSLAMRNLKSDYLLLQNSASKLAEGETIPFSIFPEEVVARLENQFKTSKLILIDFWASWCVPCREEFPFLSNAYQRFNKMGFEIISISVDKNEEKWKSALFDLSPQWSNHFLVKEAFESELIKTLRIKAIPRNYLIDSSGRIYAKDLRGSELGLILEKLL